MTTKKLDDIPVVIEEHTTLNTSKGVVYCDNKAVKDMTNEEIKKEMESQDVIEVYRIMRRKEKQKGKENEDEFEWIDLTELASEKYPHLEDDCE